MRLSLELRLIRLVLKKIVYGEEIEEIEVLLNNRFLNWRLLEELLFFHEINPFFYMITKPYAHLLPARMKELLPWFYYHAALNNQLMCEKYQVICNIFQKNGIELLPIKGIALLYDLYAEFPVRPMADIDVLICEDDYEKTRRILKDINYEIELRGLTEAYWKTKQCHVPFRENSEERSMKQAIEVHWGLGFKKRCGRTLLPHLWERLTTITIDNKKLRLLSPEDVLFSLALHQRRFRRTLCLKYVLDTALLLRKYRKEFDWNYVSQECKRARLLSCVYFLLLQGQLFFNSPDFTRGIQRLSLHKYKRNIMERFIGNNLDSYHLFQRVKENYLKSHFLLYDTYLEPLMCILTIPLEQFAKFYNFPPYNRKTRVVYKFRFPYMAYRVVRDFLKG